MKPILYMAAAIALTFAACKKEENKVVDNTLLPKTNENVDGNWKLVSSYLSPGYAVEWEPVKNGARITYKANGDYSDGRFTAYQFRITALTPDLIDTLVLLYKKDVTESDTAYMRITKLTKDTLTIWNRDCIEGCGYKYVRTK